MPRKAVQPNKVPLDPIFPIPVGAEDVFVYNRDGADLSGDYDATSEDLGIVDDVYDSVTDVDSTLLGVPDSFVIESQTVRRASGGVIVIDVVVAIDDVPGAVDYDLQVVKA